MTTHLKRLECIDWNLECIGLFLFVRLFWCFRFFCYCIFLFVLVLEQGYFNVTLLPMHPAGWGIRLLQHRQQLLQGPQEQVRHRNHRHMQLYNRDCSSRRRRRGACSHRYLPCALLFPLRALLFPLRVLRSYCAC